MCAYMSMCVSAYVYFMCIVLNTQISVSFSYGVENLVRLCDSLTGYFVMVYRVECFNVLLCCLYDGLECRSCKSL